MAPPQPKTQKPLKYITLLYRHLGTDTMPVVYCRSVCLGLLLALSTAAYYNVNILLKHRKKRSSGGSIPSRVQMMAVGCRRAFAARTAVTWFERHLVADIFCEPHETKTLIEIPPYYIDTLLFAMSTELKSDILNRLSWGRKVIGKGL
jgi:hypothetical protein